MTQTEINDAQKRQEEIILDRQTRLEKSDYIAAKIAEGKATKAEYRDEIEARQQWRDDINAAQQALAALAQEVPEDTGTAPDLPAGE